MREGLFNKKGFLTCERLINLTKEVVKMFTAKKIFHLIAILCFLTVSLPYQCAAG